MEKNKENRVPPSLDSFLGSESFHIRLTLKSNLDTIQSFVNKIGSKYIICDELTHYHIYLQTQTTKKEIIIKIKEQLNLKGNEQFSVVVVKNKQSMKKYILKDGRYVFRNFTDKEIEILRKLSFKKGIDKLKISLDKFEEDYYSGEIVFTTFACKYINLKIEYGQNIYGNHIKAYLNRIKMKKNPSYVREYVEELMRL